MNSDDKWYTPIIYMLFLAFTGWLIGNTNIEPSNSYSEVRNNVVIIDFPEYVKPVEKQVFDSLPYNQVNEASQDTLITEIEDIEETNDISSIIQEDSLFFEQFMSGIKTYDRPVKKAIIRYYKKELDQDKVKVLQRYGFYIHERPSDLEKSHVSNALYLGDSISNHDILVVAYALLKQGVELKYITESKGHDGWKANAIEVVTDTTVINNEIISLGYLRDNWGDI